MNDLGMKPNPKLDELKPIPEFDMSEYSEKELRPILMIADIIEDAYPVDANEDFHLGIQWIIYIMTKLTETVPMLPRNAILDLGIAALHLKQNRQGKAEVNEFTMEELD